MHIFGCLPTARLLHRRRAGGGRRRCCRRARTPPCPPPAPAATCCPAPRWPLPRGPAAGPGPPANARGGSEGSNTVRNLGSLAVCSAVPRHESYWGDAANKDRFGWSAVVVCSGSMLLTLWISRKQHGDCVVCICWALATRWPDQWTIGRHQQTLVQQSHRPPCPCSATFLRYSTILLQSRASAAKAVDRQTDSTRQCRRTSISAAADNDCCIRGSQDSL